MILLLTWLIALAPAQDLPTPVLEQVLAAPLPEAPELNYGYFLSQGPAKADAAGQLTVVELWATWCGPCHKTFPVLTRLQASYGDQIRIIALTDERQERVRKFFHENRENMRFAIAVGDSEAVQSLMFGGFRGRAIPSVYVMRDGQMLWSGAPEELEEALVGLTSPAV